MTGFARRGGGAAKPLLKNPTTRAEPERGAGAHDGFARRGGGAAKPLLKNPTTRAEPERGAGAP